MTMIHHDGFDSYANITDMGLVYSAISGFGWIAVHPTGGRYGGGAIHAENYDACFVYPLSTPQTEIWTGFAISCTSNPTANQSFFGIVGISGAFISLQYNSVTGVMSVYEGPYGSLLCYFGINLTIGTYHWVELHVRAGASGYIELWVDDIQRCTYTGTLPTEIVSVSMLGDTANNACTGMLIDDFYILNTSGTENNIRLGDGRMTTLLPRGDVGPNQGTPSSGSSHFAMVDEATSDYNTTTLTLTNTAGQEELFDFTPLTTTPEAIFSVRVFNTLQKSDGAPCTGSAVIKSGGSVANGANNAVLTSYSTTEGIFENDPATGVPWLYSSVNAINAGFVVTTA